VFIGTTIFLTSKQRTFSISSHFNEVQWITVETDYPGNIGKTFFWLISVKFYEK